MRPNGNSLHLTLKIFLYSLIFLPVPFRIRMIWWHWLDWSSMPSWASQWAQTIEMYCRSWPQSIHVSIVGWFSWTSEVHRFPPLTVTVVETAAVSWFLLSISLSLSVSSTQVKWWWLWELDDEAASCVQGWLLWDWDTAGHWASRCGNSIILWTQSSYWRLMSYIKVLTLKMSY